MCSERHGNAAQYWDSSLTRRNSQSNSGAQRELEEFWRGISQEEATAKNGHTWNAYM